MVAWRKYAKTAFESNRSNCKFQQSILVEKNDFKKVSIFGVKLGPTAKGQT